MILCCRLWPPLNTIPFILSHVSYFLSFALFYISSLNLIWFLFLASCFLLCPLFFCLFLSSLPHSVTSLPPSCFLLHPPLFSFWCWEQTIFRYFTSLAFPPYPVTPVQRDSPDSMGAKTRYFKRSWLPWLLGARCRRHWRPRPFDLLTPRVISVRFLSSMRLVLQHSFFSWNTKLVP